MNPTFLTILPSGRQVSGKDEVLSDWHDGKSFRMYQYGPVSIHDSLRMQMAGFTHVTFLWQDADFQLQKHTIELKPVGLQRSH